MWLVVHHGFTRLLDVVNVYKHYMIFSTEPIEMGQEQWPFRATEQSPKVFVILSVPFTGVSIAACGLPCLPWICDDGARNFFLPSQRNRF
jgi:hypothetical protein